MKSGVFIVIIGSFMVISGLILFYLTPFNTYSEPIFRSMKHSGTFIGLMGIGVTIAGILLYLINRNQTSIEDNQNSEFR